ncbi:chromate transporter [Paenibacillus cremeus]|uniref:Chromate transporter n=1 Tax=Paenibacillus cremeus TaxID=2163881 RepID=A0A559K903_9BACL|nr:chromate transporter [Paenibacillus cremeus]TVY08573.1 chromate transporter [Paenibacillus cremeus]
MIWIQLFMAFFIPSIVGYGGGPASIPLIQNEVVGSYGWYTVERFGEVLAIGNALPGPIATKMAGYIGYEQGGILGALSALFATVAPSLLAMVFLLGLLYKYRHSPRVKQMTLLIRPAICVMLAVLAYQFLASSWQHAGIIHTVLLSVIGYLCLERWKISPPYVIVGALLYGALIIA